MVLEVIHGETLGETLGAAGDRKPFTFREISSRVENVDLRIKSVPQVAE